MLAAARIGLLTGPRATTAAPLPPRRWRHGSAAAPHHLRAAAGRRGAASLSPAAPNPLTLSRFGRCLLVTTRASVWDNPPTLDEALGKVDTVWKTNGGSETDRARNWLAAYIIKKSLKKGKLTKPRNGNVYAMPYEATEKQLLNAHPSVKSLGAITANSAYFGTGTVGNKKTAAKEVWLNITKLLGIEAPKKATEAKGSADTASTSASADRDSSPKPKPPAWQDASTWEEARVVFVSTRTDFASMVVHVLGCNIFGLDFEHQDAPSGSSGGGQGGARRELVLMQIAAPPAPVVCKPATIYLVDVMAPEAADWLLQPMAILRRELESAKRIKVVHDAREDAKVLWEQYGIVLGGVCDTQVLHGLSWFGTLIDAAAAEDPWDGRRISLLNLYEMGGFPHPQKLAEQAQFKSAGRTWSQRPLPDDLQEYAASDVRYLLPLYHKLTDSALGFWPSALSSLQARLYAGLSPQGAPAHENGQKLLPRVAYSLSIDEVGFATYDLAAAVKLRAEATATSDEEQQEQQDSPVSTESEAPSDAESPSICEAENAADATDENLSWIFEDEACPGNEDAADTESPVAASDEGVASLLPLLPESLQAQLHPWLAPKPGEPRLEELLLHGRVRPARVRLSDGTVVDLSVRIPLSEALQALERVRLNNGAAYAGDWGDGGLVSGAGFEEMDGGWETRYGLSSRLFDSENRLALPGSLHRISAAMARSGKVVGLTYRVGRHMPGTAAPLRDLLHHMARVHRGQSPGKCFNPSVVGRSSTPTMPLATSSGSGLGGSPSLLLLGCPGTGKTTVLRDVARVFSDELGLSVVVVDTSNEIAGDGDEPHPCIGSALRLQVSHHRQQANVMLEAVQNHRPDVVIVDEIGTREEANAARQIAQRGVMLVATAHGLTLGDLMSNPDLVYLLATGGIKGVTPGARARSGNKTKMERAGAGVFQLLVELSNRRSWRVHLSVDSSVDALLEGQAAHSQVRTAVSATEADAVIGGGAAHTDPQLKVVFETAGAARQAVALAAEAAAATEGGGGGSVGDDADGQVAISRPRILADTWLPSLLVEAAEVAASLERN